jgi:hypothetical protein
VVVTDCVVVTGRSVIGGCVVGAVAEGDWVLVGGAGDRWRGGR